MSDIITERIKEYENEYRENQKSTNKPKNKFENIRQIIFIIIGIINILFANRLRQRLPIIIGTVSVVIAITSLIRNIKQKEYIKIGNMKISRNLIALILGIIILLKKDNAIPLITIIWGITELQRGCRGLNKAAYNKAHKKTFILELIHSLFQIVIAILLILDPFEHLDEHLRLLGIEMVISSFRLLLTNKNRIVHK